jgi:carbon-monoxide dehydrogenase small subunit
MTTNISFILNGEKISYDIKDHWTLLYLLREKMGMIGTKEGCGNGECGACTIIIDKLAVNSCLYLAIEAEGKTIETIEGLASTDGTLHPLQRSFVDNGGIQCGFCSPGMIMSSKALLDENPDANREEIQHALAGNICRCTGYIPIFESVEAAQKMGGQNE